MFESSGYVSRCKKFKYKKSRLLVKKKILKILQLINIYIQHGA